MKPPCARMHTYARIDTPSRMVVGRFEYRKDRRVERVSSLSNSLDGAVRWMANVHGSGLGFSFVSAGGWVFLLFSAAMASNNVCFSCSRCCHGKTDWMFLLFSAAMANFGHGYKMGNWSNWLSFSNLGRWIAIIENTIHVSCQRINVDIGEPESCSAVMPPPMLKLYSPKTRLVRRNPTIQTVGTQVDALGGHITLSKDASVVSFSHNKGRHTRVRWGLHHHSDANVGSRQCDRQLSHC